MVSRGPIIASRELVATSKLSITVPVAEPDRRVIVPVPGITSSEKEIEMLLSTVTDVAPSAGRKLRIVGEEVSGFIA